MSEMGANDGGNSSNHLASLLNTSKISLQHAPKPMKASAANRSHLYN